MTDDVWTQMRIIQEMCKDGTLTAVLQPIVDGYGYLIYCMKKRELLLVDIEDRIWETDEDDLCGVSQSEMAEDPEIKESIAALYEEREDCNVAYNDTLGECIREIAREVARDARKE